MLVARYALLAGSVAPLVVIAASCTSEPPSATAPTASASAAPPPTRPPASASAAPNNSEDEVKPLYPETKDPPSPEATRYCDLMYEVAEKKRNECCPSLPFTGFRPTGECVRTLSYALGTKAVSIEKADLDACEAAVLEEAKRCDWGGTTPPACEGIVRGQVESGALCRSSLECKSGLHCEGLGTSEPGKCAPALSTGQRCGGMSDTLAAFIRQDAERDHPTCEGYCARRLCAPVSDVGQPCKTSLQCGRDKVCVGGKCSDAPLPAAGLPCAQNMCAAGLSCVNGTCAALHRIDEACKSDAECRSAYCERADGGEGKCSMSCQVIRPAPTASAKSKKR